MVFYRFLVLLIVFQIISASELTAQNDHVLDPEKTLSQYSLDIWSTGNGFPTNAPLDVFQSRDGYLWIGSFSGLIRFDGIKFSVFNKSNTPAFKTNTISKIIEDKNGVLWLGTNGSGLVSFHKGEFKNYRIGQNDTYLITYLAIDSKNRIWVGTRGKGVFIFDGGLFTPVSDSVLTKSTINVISEDVSTGEVWIGTEGNGIVKVSKKSIKYYNGDNGLAVKNIYTILKTKSGGRYIGTDKGLYSVNSEIFRKEEFAGDRWVNEIFEDKHQNLWLGTSSGLLRKHYKTGKVEVLTEQHGLPNANIIDIILDQEGSMWLTAYRGGLCRLKSGKFTNYTPREGLASESVNSITILDKNTFLIGTDFGVINKIQNQEVSVFPVKTKLPKERIRHILKDSKNNIWISSYAGLLKISANGSEKLYTTGSLVNDNLVRLTYEDKSGNIWIGTRSGGLTRLSPDGVIARFTKENGLSSNFIMSIAEDHSGNILVGTNDAGLNIITPKTIKILNMQDGLGGNLIFNIHIDSKKVIWLVTNGGVSVIDGGIITNLTTTNGLPSETPFDMIEDNQGNAWFSSSEGVFKISKKSLDNIAKGDTTKVTWIKYDRQDGMVQSECTASAQIVKSDDGSLWFPTLGGIATINPEKIRLNSQKPPVLINRFTADNQGFNLEESEIQLRPGTKRIIIDYTALSLLAPHSVHFKYKLDNFDQDWVDAGNTRQATYTSLTPGDYTFRVIASNNDGVWNDVGAMVNFKQRPYFFQNPIFYLTVALVLLGSALFFHRWRVYQIKVRNILLEKLVQQRTKEIKKQKSEIEQKNKDITSSINYAKGIQESILPDPAFLEKHFPDSFVFCLAKDIVNGDFFWFSKVGRKYVFAVVDCTGHGVPGAFMTVLANTLLNEIVNKSQITSPDIILFALNQKLFDNLHYESYELTDDGMDIAIVVYDPDTGAATFSGAKRNLVYIADGQIHEIQGNRFSIGGYRSDTGKKFHSHKIQLRRGDSFYLFTDGYTDQFGGKENKKFMKKDLIRLFNEIHMQPMKDQGDRIAREFYDWKGKNDQTDDVLVLGIRPS